jgi:hypothetical protein
LRRCRLHNGGIGAARQENGMNARSLSRGLGWFSVALGTAELLGGRRMAQSLGMEHRTPLFRLFGLREILVGFGILAKPTSPALLWARVGGDALDLAVLAADGLRRGNPRRTEVDIAMGMVAAVTALDILCGYQPVDEFALA